MDSIAKKVLFWSVYALAVVAAGYHSFLVFSLSDPVWVAFISAVAIDGLTAYSMMQLGRWTSKYRAANLAGVVLFAIVSILAQVISRFHGLGVTLPEWLRIVSLFLVPAATTGAVVTLGVIHWVESYGDSKVEIGTNPVLSAVTDLKTTVSEFFTHLTPPAQTDKSDTPLLEPAKRGPGRPPKVVYASEQADPKVASKVQKK